MQPMRMDTMHDLLWRENQVIVTFHSDTPLVSSDGVNNAPTILKQLDLDSQLQKLNQFLNYSAINYTLSFFNWQDNPKGSPQSPSSGSGQKASTFNPPLGVYLYGLSKPIDTEFGQVQTSVVTFFNFTASAGGASAVVTPPGIDLSQSREVGPVPTIVNAFNQGLKTLNGQQISISAASPVWMCGGTPPVPQGCPLTPPLPLEDSCAYWHYQLPHLSPVELQDMRGEGVIVFVLDTLPERKVISDAAQKAGDDNLLLVDINNVITPNYNFLSSGIEEPDPDPAAVGKDVYGEHYPIEIADHGLFIAGIIHDIAPSAKIECVRVLDKYCVGDLYMLHDALQYIGNRMLQGGDLDQQPVVINMSLVIPTKDDARLLGLNPDIGADTNDVETCVRQSIQSLVGLGAIIAASAGNEADLREDPTRKRPPALYPAGFAYPPESVEGIVPVGAVDMYGNAASYSCYPGSRGIATYGGEIPRVDPPKLDPNASPVVTVTDAVRGIYSSDSYPALVAPQPPTPGDPVPEYTAPDNHAWAYWVGTSFATPVISGVAARILEMKAKGAIIPNVHDAILAAARTDTTNWDNLDPARTGVSTGSADGPMLLAEQTCNVVDEDQEEEVDIEVIDVVVEK